MQKHHIKKKNFIAHKKNQHYSYKGSAKELGRPGREVHVSRVIGAFYQFRI